MKKLRIFLFVKTKWLNEMVQSVAAKYGETKAINPRFVNHIYPFNVKKFGLDKMDQKF